MDDDLYNLEVLSCVAKISQEILNHTGIDDKTLAEFVISLHEQSKSITEFKQLLKDTGAEFPDSFVENLDRLILHMHPKHKKATYNKENGQGASQEAGVLSEKEKYKRMFPGLAIPDEKSSPAMDKDRVMQEVDSLMAELEGVAKKARTLPFDDDRESKRPRRSRSRSPRRSRSPGYRSRDDKREGRRPRQDAGRGRGRVQLDERPVLYKIYDGKVTGLKEFGAFVSLDGIAGKAEGMYFPLIVSQYDWLIFFRACTHLFHSAGRSCELCG